MRGAYPGEYGEMPQGDANFGGVLSALYRAKVWIVLATLLAFAGAVVFVNVVKPKYTGEAKVLLENRENYFTRPDREMRGSDPVIDAEAVQSQVQVIMSRDLAKSVIQKLDLASLEEFDSVKKEPSTLKRVLAILGIGKDPLSIPPEERVLEAYMDKLLVYNLGKSRVISVEFSSKDPELAAKAANLIADEYIRFQREAKKSTTQGASAWLAQAIEPLRAKVAEAEAKVEAYRAQNGLLIGTSNTTIATQQLGEMNTQMSAARSAQTELQAKARLIREALRTGRIFETSEVVNNELVRRLLEQRVAMKTQIALEERTLLPGHPRMKELQAQIRDLEDQIRTAAERTARTLENDARVAGARVQSLQAEFEGQKRTAASSNESEVQLRALEREARALRDNYESYLAKYRDALSRDADAAAPADARVVSRAIAPQQPTFPKKVPVILLATLATLVLSCAIVITRQVFSTGDAGDYALQTPVPMPAPMPASMSATPANEPTFAEVAADTREPDAGDGVRQDDVVAPEPLLNRLRLRPRKPVVEVAEDVAPEPMISARPVAAQPAPAATVAPQPAFVAPPVAAPAPQPVPVVAPPLVAEAPVTAQAPVAPAALSYPQARFEDHPAQVFAPTQAYVPPVAFQPPPAAYPQMQAGYPHGHPYMPQPAPMPMAPPVPQQPYPHPQQHMPAPFHAGPMPHHPMMPPVANGPAPEPMLRQPHQPVAQRPVAPEVPVVEAPEAAVNEPLLALAEDLAAMKPADVGLIVSCHAYGRDVPTSGTSLPLARMLSRLGTTVLVDLGGARGETDQAVGRAIRAGFTDLVAGQATFASCIHRDKTSKAHVIAFGQAGFGAKGPDPLSDDVLDVLDALVQTYDFVVLDAGMLGSRMDDIVHQSGAVLMLSSQDDQNPDVARVFQQLDAIRPGCVTIVVEEPTLPAPRPANDRFPSARGVA